MKIQLEANDLLVSDLPETVLSLGATIGAECTAKLLNKAAGTTIAFSKNQTV